MNSRRVCEIRSRLTPAGADSAYRRSLYRGFLALLVDLFSEVISPQPALRLSLAVGVRHEVARVFVTIEQSGCNPVFCHWYPTGACVVRKTIPLGMLAGYEAFGTKVSLIERMVTDL